MKLSTFSSSSIHFSFSHKSLYLLWLKVFFLLWETLPFQKTNSTLIIQICKHNIIVITKNFYINYSLNGRVLLREHRCIKNQRDKPNYEDIIGCQKGFCFFLFECFYFFCSHSNRKIKWFTLTELNSIISLFELFYDAVDFKIVVHFNAFLKLFLVRFLSCKNNPSPEFSHDLGNFYEL